MISKKVKRIYANLEKEVDLIVLKNAIEPFIDNSFLYVTGYTSGLFEGSYALLYPDGVLEVLTSPLEEQLARKGKCKVTILPNREIGREIIQKHLKGVKRIGINAEELTHRDYLQMKKISKGSRFIDISDAIKKTRAVKEEDELVKLRKACKITSVTANNIPKMLHEGVTENEVAAEICYEMQTNGGDGLAFDTIIAFGPHSAEPHYLAGDTKLKKGNFIVADFGSRYKKYCADITRTFLFGEETKRHREIYDFVKHLQVLALDEIREGVEGKVIQEVVENAVKNSKFKGKFPHGVGHSLGICTHDGIGFANPTGLVLEEGMVFTVEPGIYIPGWGGVRIEDDIVVKKNGYEMLTHANKDLVPIRR